MNNTRQEMILKQNRRPSDKPHTSLVLVKPK